MGNAHGLTKNGTFSHMCSLTMRCQLTQRVTFCRLFEAKLFQFSLNKYFKSKKLTLLGWESEITCAGIELSTSLTCLSSRLLAEI
jgi:hypothetical protein